MASKTLCPHCSGSGRIPNPNDLSEIFECFECKFPWSQYRRLTELEMLSLREDSRKNDQAARA